MASQQHSQLRTWFSLKRYALIDRFGHFAYFIQFGIVGGLGAAVNLIILSFCQYLGMSLEFSVGTAIFISMLHNFFLNRFITFRYAKNETFWPQFFGFILASSLGAFVNYVVTMNLVKQVAFFEKVPQLAALGGILAGMIFNFGLNRFWIFREKKEEPAEEKKHIASKS